MAIETGRGAPTLADAIRALAARNTDEAQERNDVGYNGGDSSWGNRLAELAMSGRLRWRPGEYEQAYARIRKYRKQLASYGVDFDAIPATGTVAVEQQRPATGGMVARAPGRCARCGGAIRAGDVFAWGAQRGDRVHGECPSTRGASESRPGASGGHSGGQARIASERVETPGLDTYAVDGILGPGGAIARTLDGYESRDAQMQGARLIERALAAQSHALVEAGTGTGKSLMALVPAIASGRKVIYSTADKALQEQIAQKDVPFLQSVGFRDFDAVVVKGRGNYVCRQRVAELGEQLDGFAFKSEAAAAAWPAVRAWLDETESGDLETCGADVPAALREQITTDSDGCLGQKCPLFGSCYSERVKARAKDAQVVIVNHALLLRDRMVRDVTDGHASLLPDSDALVLDEAHHLEAVATDAFGVELTAGAWARIARRIDTLTTEHKAVRHDETHRYRDTADTWVLRATALGAAVEGWLATIAARLAQSKSQASKLGDERGATGPLTLELGRMAEDMREGTPEWLVTDAEREGWKRCAKSVETLGRTLELAATPDPARVRFAQSENGRLKVLVKPIDVSDLLRRMVWESYETVVGMSATITAQDGFEHWRVRVGCDDADELQVASPFDFARNALLYLPADAAAFVAPAPGADGTLAYTDRLAAEVERLILASDGRAFVLFTSVRTLQAVYERLAPRLRYTLLKQGDGLNRAELVRRFKADGRAVLFGVKSFWEGVDVKGEALSLVVIDKLPFTPPDDPVWEARCEAITRAGGSWFHTLALPAAIVNVKQGFGRLIRTKSDRGVVALLDGRLTLKKYGPSIIAALPPATRTSSVDAVRAFYGISC